jgi:hypothetical protein
MPKPMIRWTLLASHKWMLRFLVELRDLWVGIYWNVDCTHGHIYIFPLPCIGCQFTWVRNQPTFSGNALSAEFNGRPCRRKEASHA